MVDMLVNFELRVPCTVMSTASHALLSPLPQPCLRFIVTRDLPALHKAALTIQGELAVHDRSGLCLCEAYSS